MKKIIVFICVLVVILIIGFSIFFIGNHDNTPSKSGVKVENTSNTKEVKTNNTSKDTNKDIKKVNRADKTNSENTSKDLKNYGSNNKLTSKELEEINSYSYIDYNNPGDVDYKKYPHSKLVELCNKGILYLDNYTTANYCDKGGYLPVNNSEKMKIMYEISNKELNWIWNVYTEVEPQSKVSEYKDKKESVDRKNAELLNEAKSCKGEQLGNIYKEMFYNNTELTQNIGQLYFV